MDLHGKIALVTGGARRLGKALALDLAAAGADVAINYHRSQREAQRTLREIEELGRRAITLRADVASGSEVRAMVQAVGHAFGRLDVVVNSASTFERTPLGEIEEVEWDRVLGVNLKGPFLVAQAAAELVRRGGGGVIVNIADLSAFQGWTQYAHHAVSKAGLVHLTRVLARALAPDIRVNCIAPGTVLRPDDFSEEDLRRERERTLLARDGTPEDVTRALRYLVASDWVTGQTLVVDGGRILW